MRYLSYTLLLNAVIIPAQLASGHGFELTLATSGGVPSSMKAFAEFPGNYMDNATATLAPGNLFYAPFTATPASNSLGAYYGVYHGSPYTAGTWPTYTATYNVISPLYFSDGVATSSSGTGPSAAVPASAGTFMTVYDRYAGFYAGASSGTATLSGTTSYVAGYGISLTDPHELQKDLYISSSSSQTYGEYGYAYDVAVKFSNGQTLTSGPLVTVFAMSDRNLGDFSDNAPVIQQDEATLAIFNAAIKTPATWNTSGSGSFNDYTKWTTSAVPSGPGQTVVINAPVLSPTTITLDATQYLGLLTLGNSASNSAGYTLAAGTLSNGNGGTLIINNLDTAGIISVTSGSNAISAPIVLQTGLVIASTAGSSLNISGNFTEGTSGMSLSVGGGGVVILSGSNSYTGGTTVTSGTLVLDGASSLLAGSSLSIGSVGDSSGSVVPSRAPIAITVPAPEPPTLLMLAVAVALAAALYRRRGYFPSTFHST
jgi:autotransporter-associated beta strand protein